MGDLLFIVAVAVIAAAIGLGVGIVLSRTLMRWIADRAARNDEEPGDRHD